MRAAYRWPGQIMRGAALLLSLSLGLACVPDVLAGSTPEQAENTDTGDASGHAEIAGDTVGEGLTGLPIPPLLNLADEGGVRTGTLTAAAGTHEFVPGMPSESLGYNGSYLGPTIELEREGSYVLSVSSELDELTTVHWHGLDVRADSDGGPRQPIAPGETWAAVLDIHQPASTAWYHPHAMGTTAKQVAMGLAGMIIIRDGSPEATAAEALLPHTYGVDDLPVILQDKRLDAEGRNSYRPAMPDVMHGYAGNVLVTNGAVEPVADVPAGWVRLRLLNGSNASYIRVTFPNELDARVIAGDGGFLAEAVGVSSLVIAAGERYEVLVNAAAVEGISWIEAVTDAGVSGRLLGLRPGVTAAVRHEREADELYTPVVSVPSALPAPPVLVTNDTAVSDLPRRRFTLESRGMMTSQPFTINGKTMDMDRIDEVVRLGELEIWEIANVGPMNITHTFHTHSTTFQVITFAGEVPPATMAGRKDTVIVPAGTTVEIAVRFERHTGVFMYHCHMLEHEESGMMGQFLVE